MWKKAIKAIIITLSLFTGVTEEGHRTPQDNLLPSEDLNQYSLIGSSCAKRWCKFCGKNYKSGGQVRIWKVSSEHLSEEIEVVM